MTTSADFLSRAQAMADQLTAWRRDIHMHPELSFQEQRTASLVADALDAMGIEAQIGVGKTGVVGFLGEGSQEAFEEWLAELSATERKAIRVVAMDMWGPYRGVVKAKLPQAEIVADRFHVTKHLNEAIAKIRRTLQTKANKAEYELLKGTRWILVRQRADLKPAEEANLQAVLAAFPALRTAYLLKEKFQAIANKFQDRQRAERFLRIWVYEAQASGLHSC